MQPLTRCPLAALLAFTAGILVLSLSMAAAQEPRPTLEFGIGASALRLSDIEFAAITDFFVTEVEDHQTNHDGDFNGYKLTGELSGLMPTQRGDWMTSLAVKGFYARYQDDQQTRCLFTATTDCVFLPLFDPDPTGTITSPGGSGSGGFFSDWLTNVDREVVHWGAAVEVDLSRFSASAPSLKDGGGSLKDAPVAVAPVPFEWRAGVAARRLDQKTSLISIDRGLTQDPVTLNENSRRDLLWRLSRVHHLEAAGSGAPA